MQSGKVLPDGAIICDYAWLLLVNLKQRKTVAAPMHHTGL